MQVEELVEPAILRLFQEKGIDVKEVHPRVKTKLEKSNDNQEIFDLTERGLKWLQNNDYSNPVLKWDTVNWGEIPADFGRK